MVSFVYIRTAWLGLALIILKVWCVRSDSGLAFLDDCVSTWRRCQYLTPWELLSKSYSFFLPWPSCVSLAVRARFTCSGWVCCPEFKMYIKIWPYNSRLFTFTLNVKSCTDNKILQTTFKALLGLSGGFINPMFGSMMTSLCFCFPSCES